MVEQAILHLQDSQYCYATGGNAVEIMLRTGAGDAFEAVELIYGSKYDYYLVQQRVAMNKRFSDGLYDYYTVSLTLSDVRLVYIFALKENGKTHYFSEDGLTEKYDFAFAYYNAFQFPYINAADVMQDVKWMHSAVFYEIFVERFCRGDFVKDDAYIDLKWGEIPTPKSFAGGDLAGIVDKLDYLKNLGVSALYLTPIFQSVSNHKYDISDYYTVDKQFGDNRTFKRLVEEAHARGIRVVLDAVFNHCSEHSEQFRDVVKNGKKSPYFDWFIIRGDAIDTEAGNYECFGACKYMPKFNTSNSDVQKFLLDVATHWIEKYDIDGWRLDVSDEVSHDFWRAFRKSVKAAKPDCVILGENWHDSAPFLRGDQFDGIMNYALTKACLDYFVNGAFSATDFANKLSALYVRNNKTANGMMLNLLDSHDTHRFYTLADKNADKLACALAVVFMHTGAPCVYYGTEVLTEGGYDPDCRRTMDWDDGRENIRPLLRALADLRRSPEIKDGAIAFGTQGELFILDRIRDGVLRLYVNATDKAVAVRDEGETLLAHNYRNGKLGSNGFLVVRRTQ